MACKNCEYFDSNERSGYKGYCTYYKTYEDPDGNYNCNHFKSSSSSSGCYFTTCCCEYYGKNDDCYELQTMRNFRDNYLRIQSDGQNLINRYYINAPIIVGKIKASEKYSEICEDIYSYISNCCDLIESGKLEECKNVYISMVRKYENIYLN